MSTAIFPHTLFLYQHTVLTQPEYYFAANNTFLAEQMMHSAPYFVPCDVVNNRLYKPTVELFLLVIAFLSALV